ncbi:phage tail protein [Qipengyuania soli]|uniref:Phage tail protein n=1 Tax=Qipengyuania soli TaxID=2782568 RepID=A0A7S8F1R2_9SPHN|nr:phage tail protein [Qipengyuania soli]QPC98555.1 phage tail protein [Qipengyuania soli]
MATVVLTTLGSLFGGPLGGAVGTLIGRQIDGAIISGPKSEGPRLKDLAVSTSSYGQPIARHYGSVRAAGTVIWATDLKETKQKSGGGKGRPSSTSYVYSVSFAVALSSRPIEGIGRIWADGNLLRGSGGDLKSSGALRIHSGHGDQRPDPLLAAELGDKCPAHRGCAYVVFEDLSLADFGNRIPALTFEILAGDGAGLLPEMVGNLGSVDTSALMDQLKGYSHDGGSLAGVLAQVDRLKPVVPLYRGGALRLAGSSTAEQMTKSLPPPATWDQGEFGREDGRARARGSLTANALSALRYYDPARDYQPGMQRAEGGATATQRRTLEFPGVLSAQDARMLLREASMREAIGQETLSWRVAQLDPALGPGSKVKVPGIPGTWRVAEWEWRGAGIELQLVRHLQQGAFHAVTSDPGDGWHPPDREIGATSLRVFELPWDGHGSNEEVRIFGATSAPAGPWAGAALFAQQGTALEPVGNSGPSRATTGKLLQPLEPSPAHRFEQAASLLVKMLDHSSELVSTDSAGLARGVNRMLVGEEVLQFAQAEPLGEGEWKLTGLLRGRGGSERPALAGHAAGSEATLLDEDLLLLRVDLPALAGSTEFAAIGLAESEPVKASLENQGASRRPPSPCHGCVRHTDDGALAISWTRRARGGWIWQDEVEQPLVERQELYEVGIGPPSAPLRSFTTPTPDLVLGAATLADLTATHPDSPIWVRQCGDYSKSQPLMLGHLAG